MHGWPSPAAAILRLDAAAPCPADAAGRAFALTFAPDGAVVVRVRPVRTGETLGTPDRIPPIAWAIAPRVPLTSGEQVSVVVDVYVPARTPATDDIYLATERSNWNPTEIRMNRVDGRHFSATIVVSRGTRWHCRSHADRMRPSSGMRPAPFPRPTRSTPNPVPSSASTSRPGPISIKGALRPRLRAPHAFGAGPPVRARNYRIATAAMLLCSLHHHYLRRIGSRSLTSTPSTERAMIWSVHSWRSHHGSHHGTL